MAIPLHPRGFDGGEVWLGIWDAAFAVSDSEIRTSFSSCFSLGPG